MRPEVVHEGAHCEEDNQTSIPSNRYL